MHLFQLSIRKINNTGREMECKSILSSSLEIYVGGVSEMKGTFMLFLSWHLIMGVCDHKLAPNSYITKSGPLIPRGDRLGLQLCCTETGAGYESCFKDVTLLKSEPNRWQCITSIIFPIPKYPQHLSCLLEILFRSCKINADPERLGF